MFDILFSISGLDFSLMGLIAIGIFAVALLTRDQTKSSDNKAHKQTNETTRIVQRGGSQPMRQRQLHKKQAQNMPQAIRDTVSNLDMLIDTELDYQPPIDKIAGLPEEFQQQVLSNMGSLVQKAVNTWLQTSNEMITLTDERQKRLDAEIIITRNILTKLPHLIDGRKLVINLLKEGYEDLSAIAGDDDIWQQLVDEDFNGLATEIIGMLGTKLEPNQTRMLLLEARRAQQNSLKSKRNNSPTNAPSENGTSASSTTSEPKVEQRSQLDEIMDAFATDESAQPSRVSSNGKAHPS